MPSYTWLLSAPAPSPGPSMGAAQVFSGEAERDLPDWGFDIMVFPTLDMTWTPRRDHLVLADAIIRRWFTPRGRLRFHPNYGFDIRDYLNDEITIGTLAAIKAEAEAQAEQDERIIQCDVRVAYDVKEEKLSIKASLDSDVGPFSMVASITDLTTAIWLEE